MEQRRLHTFVLIYVIRTMATWGSTPCQLEDEDDEDDEYNSEMGAEEEEEQDECTESSSDDDIQIYTSSRKQSSYSNRKNQGRSEGQDEEVMKPDWIRIIHVHLCPQQPQPPRPRSG